MTPPSLPSLTIPPDITTPPDLSRSSSIHGLNASTGRPTKWSRFHQCGMALLYLYTTLPVQQIISVVYRKSPLSAPPPGTDSANKNLSNLLDKQPRWLRPKSSEDMGCRLEQLALSSSRVSSRSSESSYARASSAPLEPSLLATPFKSESSVSPTLLDVPHHLFNSWSAPTSPIACDHAWAEFSPPYTGQTPQVALPVPQEEQESLLFEPFLRRAAFTSSSTATSASSLKNVLVGYSSPYRRVVKELLRRLPSFSSRSRPTSPFSEANSAVLHWLSDDVAPSPYIGAPFPLPGDFLSFDTYMRRPQTLNDYSRSYLHSAAEELQQDPTAPLPWVTPAGLTENGLRILSHHVHETDFDDVDAFGNTLLHFVAARGPINTLISILEHPKARDILPEVNTAGQSFLHVMNQDTMNNATFVTELVRFLKHVYVIDIYAQDHYGRNFFHMLRANGVSQATVDILLDNHDIMQRNPRDAFGEALNLSATPMVWNPPTDYIAPADGALDPVQDSVLAQLNLVTFINKAIENPSMEYSQGRNGFHCLAAANLSMDSGAAGLGMAQSILSPATSSGVTTPNGRRRTSGGNRRETDSSDRPMMMRLDSLTELLNSGVRPDAYDANGNTPLMAFVALLPEDGNHKLGPDILRALIKGGADVNARNRAGETALHIAARCGRKLAARTLVTEGANVYARDAAGRSVLEVVDAKINTITGDCVHEFVRLEACRAWLSGQSGRAVQNPTVLDEWGMPAK
ncbi:hypothetical protein V2A60_008615 [Cordyceps javanica]|uniref:Ankyrin repeat-containing domain n=1 Tax=Cordyceps javanica TaxID=43265 RepID=A0A545VP94_9HYPO|nr:ankyrin repeat-containing domain [Cordyceps javanica]TQW03547.1 ankyrin repeat-containing domain [Cordyceps javanica]